MKQRFERFLPAVLAVGILAGGCASAEPSSSSMQKSSARQGKYQMLPKSPLLNEILNNMSSLPVGKQYDVQHIVEKYFPIGSKKDQVKSILDNMDHEYAEQSPLVIDAGFYRVKNPLHPNPGIFIQLIFDEQENLVSIKSYAMNKH